MSIIGLIPARGGSKGVPRKNIIDFHGKPLISHTINSAKESNFIDRIIVSTDDTEIANIASSFGAEIPFLRPSKISKDSTSMISVLNHFILWIEENHDNIECIVLLQPTSPFRKGFHIDESISIFRESKATSVVSVVEVPHQFNPYSVMQISSDKSIKPYLKENKKFSRRQDKPKFFARNGPAILICRPEIIKKNELYGDNCFPYFMSIEHSLDIDSNYDIKVGECMK